MGWLDVQHNRASSATEYYFRPPFVQRPSRDTLIMAAQDNSTATSLGVSAAKHKMFMTLYLRGLEESMNFWSMAEDIGKCKEEGELSDGLTTLLVELVMLHGESGEEAAARRNAICDEGEVKAFIELLPGPKALNAMSGENYLRLAVVVNMAVRGTYFFE